MAKKETKQSTKKESKVDKKELQELKEQIKDLEASILYSKAESENAKVSIRNVRREGNSQLKEFLKEKEISQDEERQGEEQIQKLTDLFVEKVDTILEAKEKDLLDF